MAFVEFRYGLVQQGALTRDNKMETGFRSNGCIFRSSAKDEKNQAVPAQLLSHLVHRVHAFCEMRTPATVAIISLFRARMRSGLMGDIYRDLKLQKGACPVDLKSHGY